MLVFDERWNRRELWKKSEGKRVNSAIYGQNRTLVPVPNRGGTGTTDAVAKRYRYHSKQYQYNPPESGRYRYRTKWYWYHWFLQLRFLVFLHS